MRSRGSRRRPLMEMIGVVSGSDLNGLPNQHDWFFHLPVYPPLQLLFLPLIVVHLFFHLFFVTDLYSYTVLPNLNLESVPLNVLHSAHPTVYPSSAAPRDWKVWWFIALFCCRHVLLHVRSVREEEVVCTVLQAERQDVHSGTEGCHVSYLYCSWAWHILCWWLYLSLFVSSLTSIFGYYVWIYFLI